MPASTSERLKYFERRLSRIRTEIRYHEAVVDRLLRLHDRIVRCAMRDPGVVELAAHGSSNPDLSR